MPVSCNTSVEPRGSRYHPAKPRMQTGLCLSEVGGPLFQRSPRGVGLKEHPAPSPPVWGCVAVTGASNGTDAGSEARTRLQGMRWDRLRWDGPATPQPDLAMGYPSATEPPMMPHPQGRSPSALLAVSGETPAPKSCWGGRDLIHPAPRRLPGAS